MAHFLTTLTWQFLQLKNSYGLISEGEMGRAYDSNFEQVHTGFWWEKPKGADPFEDVLPEGWIILK